MTAEKLSTLKLLREGMGKTVNVLETRGGDAFHEVRAHLPKCSESSIAPILFLITTLAFLEAGPEIDAEGDAGSSEFREIDGWTPADFLSFLRVENNCLKVSLGCVRGRAVFTYVSLSVDGDLILQTRGRGQSGTRWLAYVQGRTHLAEVPN